MAKLNINLVADIGGTNIRLGFFEKSEQAHSLKVYQCADFSSLSAVVQTYINELSLSDSNINACFAIACPVDNDLISMTNLPWTFSKNELKQTLSLNKLVLINDYTAIAHAVPQLTQDQKIKIGGGEALPNRPISICGPGTGLGVANVVPVNDSWLALGGEGGHVDFAPIDEFEQKILSFLLTKYPHVSYEQLLSGLGLEQIYQALLNIEQLELPLLSAKEISNNAITQQCDLCERSLAQFCKILGSFAGNLALTFASFGGVYIAGGIVPRFIEYFKNSEFRNRFESKGRFITFNSTIPTYVITESQPGILGASAYLRQHNLQHQG